MKTKTIDRPTCQACQSKNVMTNRSGEVWCRRCGWSSLKKRK